MEALPATELLCQKESKHGSSSQQVIFRTKMLPSFLELKVLTLICHISLRSLRNYQYQKIAEIA